MDRSAGYSGGAVNQAVATQRDLQGKPGRIDKVVDLSRDLGASEQTIYTWRQQERSAGSSRA